MSTKTILHSIDTTGPGGAETVFLDLVENLRLGAYENYAIIKGPGWVEDQLKKRNIRYYIVKPRGFLSIPYYFALAKLLKKNNTALIQAHLLGSTLTYSILGFLLRIPLVATIHGQVDLNPNEKWVWIKQLIMRFGVKQLIAVSKDLRDYIEQRKLFPAAIVKVIYNGINENKYQVADSRRLRHILKLSNDTLLIGCLGNVRPAKNYELLLDVVAELKSSFSFPFHVVVAGHQKAELMQKLDSKIDHLNLQRWVSFVGFQNDTAEYLRQLDLFLLTSSTEGFSIATIEAMASGLPVVATKCGGPEEIIEHHQTGLLAENGSQDDIVSKLQEILNQPVFMRELAMAGKNHAINRFSAKSMYQTYAEIYQQFAPIK
jgi:glycosyltransferase involved in cell wall biosynthesis